jgi:hypothetical protein
MFVPSAEPNAKTKPAIIAVILYEPVAATALGGTARSRRAQ